MFAQRRQQCSIAGPLHGLSRVSSHRMCTFSPRFGWRKCKMYCSCRCIVVTRNSILKHIQYTMYFLIPQPPWQRDCMTWRHPLRDDGVMSRSVAVLRNGQCQCTDSALHSPNEWSKLLSSFSPNSLNWCPSLQGGKVATAPSAATRGNCKLSNLVLTRGWPGSGLPFHTPLPPHQH